MLSKDLGLSDATRVQFPDILGSANDLPQQRVLKSDLAGLQEPTAKQT